MRTKAIAVLAVTLGLAMPAMSATPGHSKGSMQSFSDQANVKGKGSCAMQSHVGRNAQTVAKADATSPAQSGTRSGTGTAVN